MTEYGSLMDLLIDDEEHSGLVNWLADLAYHAFIKLQKGLHPGPGIILYRIFQNYWPKRLEKAKENYGWGIWLKTSPRHLDLEEAELLRSGDKIYFKAHLDHLTYAENQLGLEPERPYIVEDIKSDSFLTGEKRIRIKLQGIDGLFLWRWFGRKIN